jgi:hypothetical protein
MMLNKRIVGYISSIALLLIGLLSNAQDAQLQDTIGKKKKVKSDSSAKKIKLFKDDVPLQMTLTTDIRQLTGEKSKAAFQKAVVTCRLPDSTDVKEEIELRARGNFRKDYCYIPSLMLNFKTVDQNKMASLEKMKMVCTCRMGKEFEQLVLKEYIAYKIFNTLTDKSFRVRLVNMTFIDSEGKKKPISQYGFLIEDVDDMAKRNNCRELELKKLQAEASDRKYMTMVNLFQYMIGNTDWSVPGDHNIKLIQHRDSANARPFAVPYDFDFAGLVNASYAIPDEQLGTTSVRERVYRGFPRTMEELQESIVNFNAKKEEIYKLITDQQLLDKRSKDDMIKYLDEFYKIINDQRSIKKEFIDNARIN